MEMNQRIKHQRERLGLTKLKVADASRLSIHQYDDIEAYADELIESVPLYFVKKLCAALELNLIDLVTEGCAFCVDPASYGDAYNAWRSTLVKRCRDDLSLTQEQLGEKVGFASAEIDLIESYPAHLESWGLSNIETLADALRVPEQVLLDVRCPACKR